MDGRLSWRPIFKRRWSLSWWNTRLDRAQLHCDKTKQRQRWRVPLHWSGFVCEQARIKFHLQESWPWRVAGLVTTWPLITGLAIAGLATTGLATTVNAISIATANSSAWQSVQTQSPDSWEQSKISLPRDSYKRLSCFDSRFDVRLIARSLTHFKPNIHSTKSSTFYSSQKHEIKHWQWKTNQKVQN